MKNLHKLRMALNLESSCSFEWGASDEEVTKNTGVWDIFSPGDLPFEQMQKIAMLAIGSVTTSTSELNELEISSEEIYRAIFTWNDGNRLLTEILKGNRPTFASKVKLSSHEKKFMQCLTPPGTPSLLLALVIC